MNELRGVDSQVLLSIIWFKQFITQFIHFFSLLEAGVTGVVRKDMQVAEPPVLAGIHVAATEEGSGAAATVTSAGPVKLPQSLAAGKLK